MSIAASAPVVSPPSRLAALDLLRLVAACSVVGFHYFFRGTEEPGWLDTGYHELAGAAIYGYLGVSLFFMISGFVIALSAEGRTAVAFAVLRFMRIYPAFVFCMTLSFLVLVAAADSRLPVSLSQWLANVVIFAPAAGQSFMDGVYWSIVLELIFYGWMTLAIATGQFKARPLALVFGWLIVSAANEFVLDNGAVRLLFVTEYAAWFAAGILVYRLRFHSSSPAALVLLGAAFLLAMATSFRSRAWMLQHYGIGLSDLHLPAAVVVLFAVFLIAATWGSRLRSSPVILALGGLTYPLYLLHQNIGYITLNWLAPLLGRWPAVAMVSTGMLVLSYLVFACIEAPARRWLLRQIRYMPIKRRAHRLAARNKGLVV